MRSLMLFANVWSHTVAKRLFQASGSRVEGFRVRSGVEGEGSRVCLKGQGT